MFRYSYVVYQSYKTIIFITCLSLLLVFPFPPTLPVCSLYSHALSLDKTIPFIVTPQFNSIPFPSLNTTRLYIYNIQ